MWDALTDLMGEIVEPWLVLGGLQCGIDATSQRGRNVDLTL